MPRSRILVVEDEAIVAMSIRRSLTKLGYEVVATEATGEGAVGRALGTHLDLVIMDIRLKGNLDGIEAAERIRAAVDVPVVYLTAYSDEETLRRAKIAQPYGYVLKPYEDRELHAAVEVALYNSRLERERKDAEAAVRARDRLLQDLVDNAPALVSMKDLDGRYTLVNKGFESALGVGRADAKGRTDAELFRDARVAEALASGDERVIESGAPLQQETTLPLPDGPRTFIVAKFLLRNPEGAASGVCAMATDLTDRKRAEDSLRASEARYRLLAENTTDVIALNSPEGILRYVSPSSARVLGYSPQQMEGRPFADFVEADDFKEIILRTVERRNGAVVPCTVTYRARRGDGRAVWVESAVRGVVDEAAGSGEILLSVTRDVTERKVHEAQLERQSELLEQAVEDRTRALAAINRELESFTYSASHDLRGPLRGIQFFADVLEEDYGDRLDEEGRGHLARLRAEGARLARLVDDLLNLSRSTRVELKHERVDISALAKDVVDELARGEPDRRVESVVAPGLVAEGDLQLLRIVLMNLIGNAWKYSSRNPRARIEVGARLEDGTSTFFVRDNGVGFDSTEASRLFQPFERLSSGASFGGTGVGLSTVRRIVERHGGRVAAEGRPGEGATFSFTLPAPTRDGSAAPSSAARPVERREAPSPSRPVTGA